MREFISMEEIKKGWSEDKKYRATDKDGQPFFLRISPAEQYQRKKEEFEFMKMAEAMNIPMCAPIEFGRCPEGVYSLQIWIDGEDAEAVLPKLAENDAYRYGIQAGRILKAIHSLPAPEDAEPWKDRFNKKIDRKIKWYSECPLKYENGELFLNYIEENRYLLSDRPQSRQHGDYHSGNMMIDKNGNLVIIDFDRNDWGDPWEEFNRIVWSAQASPSFASGLIDGYFDGAPPIDFWKLLALYISSNTLSSLYWAIPFGDEEIATMRDQAREVLSWYDNMRDPIPSWYKPVK